jgi:imidazolonepropionase-like amidohydrolase
VIPGLADMHAHLYADDALPDSVGQYELGLLLAHGVTTARMMIGTPLHHRLRRDVERGTIVGPQLWIASPELSGRQNPHGIAVPTAEAARRAVQQSADSGYDFIKLTTDISPEVYDAVITAARERGVPVVGHVDGRVGVRRALAARQQIEHLDNYMESVLADSAPSRASVSDVGAYRKANWASLDHVDDRRVDAIAGETARAGVFVTPTLEFFHSWFALGATDDEIRARPDFAYLPPPVLAGWERSRARYWADPPSEARRQRYVAVRNRMVKAIVDSGGHVLAGSDGPGGLMVYGWMLHRELARLVDAGLTPMQALHAATTAPARYLKAESEWGQVRVGLRADLVLLDADPRSDIRNTSRIRQVVVGGRWLSRDVLDVMMRAARLRLNPGGG